MEGFLLPTPGIYIRCDADIENEHEMNKINTSQTPLKEPEKHRLRRVEPPAATPAQARRGGGPLLAVPQGWWSTPGGLPGGVSTPRQWPRGPERASGLSGGL